MALMRNESIERVAALLNLALPSKKAAAGVARSALTQARQRIGDEPIAYLFSRTASEWAREGAREHRWRGLDLYVMDGTTLRTPDSPENWQQFGGQIGNGLRPGSAYPMVRLVALMSVRTHLLGAVRFGPYGVGELTLAHDLWKEIPDNSVTIVDRNFLVAAQLTSHADVARGRHWLTRSKKRLKLRVVKQLGKGDALVEVMLSKDSRRAHPGLPDVWLCRAIEYQRKGFPLSTLLTSLTDPKEFPRDELVSLYHERWEVEVAYDEIKTHMLAREETIRSRTPTGVKQEL
jgi:hypothetical protein